jgi:hypothetical protein
MLGGFFFYTIPKTSLNPRIYVHVSSVFSLKGHAAAFPKGYFPYFGHFFQKKLPNQPLN